MFNDRMPRLDLVSEKAQELSDAGFDVHTFSLILYDGDHWQVRIEATDDDTEDRIFLYNLDKYGSRLTEVAEHHR